MPLDIEKLIADAKAYADDLELPFKDGTVRWGDVRGRVSAAEQRASQHEESARQWKERADTLERTMSLQGQAAEQQRRAAASNGQSEAGYDWTHQGSAARTPGAEAVASPSSASPSDYDYSDPYSRGLEARMNKALEVTMGRLNQGFTAQQQQMATALGGAAQLLLRMRAESEFNKHNDWPAEYGPDRAFQEAMNKGYIDPQSKLPDIGKLHYELTEPARMKVEAEKAYEKGKADAEKAMRAQWAEQNRSRFNKVPGGNMNRPAVTDKKGDRGPQTRRLDQFIRETELTDEDVASANAMYGIGR